MGSCSAKQVFKVSEVILESINKLLDSDNDSDIEIAKKIIMELSDPNKIARYKPKDREKIYALLVKVINQMKPIIDEKGNKQLDDAKLD